MQLHESLTVFQYLKHPGKLDCFRMEHSSCNMLCSILLKWDLKEFEPLLSFFCVWARFMLMQSLLADVLNVKFKALTLWDLRTCFWENLWSDCHKSNYDLVSKFFAVTLLNLSFSTNCQLICNSHFVWVSYAKAYCGNILKDCTHICQNFSLQNFWIVKLCMKLWHLILLLLRCLIVAIKFYWEKDRTFRSLGWKLLVFFTNWLF